MIWNALRAGADRARRLTRHPAVWGRNLVPDDRPSGTVLATRSLTKAFGGLVAVSEVDLNIKKATIHGLIGPNGSGKTTTINLVSGRYLPTHGLIFWGDHRVDRQTAHRRSRLGIIRTFQSPSLFPEFTVFDNILAGCYRLGHAGLLDATVLRWREAADRRRLEANVRWALETVGLTDRADILAKNLTFGEQKMVDFARALAAEPDILLLDEPAAGLNATEVSDLVGILKMLRESRRTVLLVEHNMRLVMGICDEITVLNFGKVIAHGQPGEIRDNRQVIEAYLGGGAMSDAAG